VSVNLRLTELTVCALPEGDINYYSYALKVQWRGRETYAVMDGRKVLGEDGEWDYEPPVSERDDDWIATHRFPYDEAVGLAVVAAPHVVVDGQRVTE
jgi:hypothetical protein